MKFFRIVNGFTRMIDAVLLARARSIHADMTGNTSFPTPVPTLTELNTSISSFETAMQAAEGGDTQAIAVRNQIRDTLISQLHMLGNYVLFTAAGDQVVATSSGFSISKIPAPSPELTEPQAFVLTSGANRGEIKLRFRKVPAARSYIYEMTQAPVTANSEWQSFMGTVCKKLFSGLESGKEYAFRVAAVGIKEQLVYSQVVSRVAL